MSTNTLHQLLLDDIGHAEQLLMLIDAEYQALQARDLQSLEKLLADKLPLLTLLDQHGQQRSRLLIEANFNPNADGLKHYANLLANGDQLLQDSKHLAELIGQCQQANVRNGRLIKANQSSTSSLLSIIRGSHGQGLYDSRGGAARIASKRPISQA
ncbi:flagella synthesis protein FlgN [Pseudomonas fluvialis]|uniref:Flagella synthesis protein FlgN n=1 Tax=Pseudomonas fluvialis TaxID=1793966 RepID=A0A7X0ER89_9PSED|nr:flagellar export chaperone FlgN [Pseudomonas fluvialis]MBB6341087.1 flagella synthesis protein FlgN [Pseudomonas fluvialis]